MPDMNQSPIDGATAIASMENRLDIIEKNSPTQGERAITRLGARAGLFATLLSIITGSFAVFSEVVTKPHEERDRTYQQFITYIQQLSSLI